VAVVPAGEKPLTNQDVLDMLAVGFDASVIIAKIGKAKTCSFDTTVECLKHLKAAGVPQSVIVATR
jgi:hypothetical protein